MEDSTMNAEKTRRIGFKRQETLIVGIDIAKQKHFAKLLFPDGNESKPFPFENTRDERQKGSSLANTHFVIHLSPGNLGTPYVFRNLGEAR